MLSALTENTQERLYRVVLLAAALLRFVNLGFKDLQAWDEALYAVRAEGILRFGGWLDQTAFAIDGLYSSLHPPVYVWLTCIAFHLFGVNEFAARFFSALLGGLTLFVIYGVGKILADRHVGLLGALLFGLHPFTTFFARQGQFDTALVFFLTSAAYFVLKNSTAPNLRNAIIAGLFTGAALMTKLYVGLGIPLVYAVWILLCSADTKSAHAKHLSVLVLIAAVVALPWHLFMTFTHGDGDPLFLLKASAVWERTVSGIEGNIKPLEGLYFVNQLFVLFPLGVVWFGYGLWNILRSREQPWLFLAVWFAVFFLVFSVMRTKLAVYLLPMLVPAALIAARELWNAALGRIPVRTFVSLLTGSCLALLWASSQEWRNLVKELLRSLIRLEWPDSTILVSLSLFLFLVIAIFVVAILLVRSAWRERMRQPLVVVISLLLFGWSLYNVVYYDSVQYNDGGKALADFIHKQRYDRLLVAGYERNPQLTFYLRGIDIGWRDDIQFRRIIPPKERETFRSWLFRETANEPATTLLVIEKDKFIRYELIQPLEIVPPDYELVFESRRYACFERVKFSTVAQRQAIR
jgi:hypothetical protein